MLKFLQIKQGGREMSTLRAIDIIKGALLLEHKGKALYESVVKTTKIEEIKDLFDFLVKEEEKHIQTLEKQFSVISGKAQPIENFPIGELESTQKIITEKISKDVFGAGYEAAVISAALELEKNAVYYYSKHQESAETEDEKKLYKWLADWEKNHMQMLANLDKEIKEQIWFDNNFWPLD
jgi:rubrerythrin